MDNYRWKLWPCKGYVGIIITVGIFVNSIYLDPLYAAMETLAAPMLRKP